jgi:predicted phage terminase large subunit-like protein
MRFERCSCVPDADVKCRLHQADPDWIPDPLDPRTESGELLFPELFPESKVRQLELDLGPYGAAGQLQQRPAPEGGGLFKREWFANRIVEHPPKLMRVARGWDTAASEGKGDYTRGCKMGEEFTQTTIGTQRILASTGRFFIIDMVGGQLGPNDVDKLMYATAQLDGKKCAQREEKEGGGAGKTVIEARRKLLKGYDYAGVQLGGSKITRAKPLRSQCEGGNVYLVRGPWNEEFLRELCAFPTGEHDDQVDAASCSFNCVLLEPPPRKVKSTW